MALLSTEDRKKRMCAVLTIHPTLAYPFFSLIRPLILRVLPKGGRICEGLLYTYWEDNGTEEPHNMSDGSCTTDAMDTSEKRNIAQVPKQHLAHTSRHASSRHASGIT